MHLAAFKGSVDCLDLLLSSGANFRLIDNDNRLALHHAASQGHYPCVFTLVGFGSDSNAQDVNGATPLHLAAAASNSNAQSYKCVQYLLQHRADPHLRDKRGFTAIHYAVAGGNQAALEALLNAPSPSASVTTASSQQSSASTTGQEEKPAPPALTPIHLAAYHGHNEILQLLLPLFPDINIKEDSGKTPLDLAAYKGHKQCIELLLQFGASVSVQDSVTKRTPVHCAAAAGHADCLTLLLQNADDPNVINRYDSKQRTALTLAVANNHPECVMLLLRYKADCNLPDINKHTPLFRAVINERDNQLVKLLLKHGARVAVQDANGKTPLHLAAACGRLYALAALVQADPTAAALKDDQGCTVLHWACYNGNSNCVEYLLNHNVYDSLEDNLFSAVLCAVYQGSAHCLDLLISKFGGQAVVAPKDSSCGLLHVAASAGSVECARLILNSVGPELAGLETTDYFGRTPLLCAAVNGQCNAIELLLEWKANVRAVDSSKNTALHLACQKRQSAAASLLLTWIEAAERFDADKNISQQQRVAIINMTNKQQRTPLHLAARNGLFAITRRLLQLGASVVAVDAVGLTPALACAPNPAVAKCLATILAAHGQNGETTQYSPSIQQTSEGYLNDRNGIDSQHSSDSEFY